MNRRKRRPVIVAVKLGISPAIVPTKVVVSAVEEDLVVAHVEADKNATSVARSAILPATALKAVLVDLEAAIVVEDTAAAAAAAALVDEVEGKPATHAAGTDICLAIVRMDRDVTIVRDLEKLAPPLLTLALGGENGHLSRDCPREATSERVCYKCKQPGHVQAACPN